MNGEGRKVKIVETQDLDKEIEHMTQMGQMVIQLVDKHDGTFAVLYEDAEAGRIDG